MRPGRLKPGKGPQRKTLLRGSPETAQKMRDRAARKRAARPAAGRGWREGRPRALCPVCGERKVTDPHHVLYQKHLRARASFEKWPAATLVRVLSDVRNRLWLCRDCNAGQESSPRKPMRREHVPASAWAFAEDLGAWAVVRLERDYPA